MSFAVSVVSFSCDDGGVGFFYFFKDFTWGGGVCSLDAVSGFVERVVLRAAVFVVLLAGLAGTSATLLLFALFFGIIISAFNYFLDCLVIDLVFLITCLTSWTVDLTPLLDLRDYYYATFILYKIK